jgi:PAS domain S-box-containing protein
VILLFEAGFVLGLGILLDQTERESKRLEHARAMIDGSNQLMEQLYVITRNGVKYLENHDEGSLRIARIARGKILDRLKYLEDQVEGPPEEVQHLQKVHRDLTEALGLADRVLELAEKTPADKFDQNVFPQMMRLRALSDGLNNDVMTFTSRQRDVEMASPEAQRRVRGEAKRLLVAGMVLNMVLAIAAGLFFTRSITDRLQRVVGNANRLKHDVPLDTPLQGDDEIAQLDGVFHDMASALQHERELLKDSEARLRGIIEIMPIGLLILNEKGEIEFANQVISKLLGHKSNELVGSPLTAYLKGRGRQNSVEVLDDLRSRSGATGGEACLISKSGQERYVEINVGNHKTADGNRELVTILDVTERIEIQKLRQAFVSMVSHELRTPLTSVMGFLSLIQIDALGAVSAELTEGAQAAERNIGRLIKLINELLDLEKLESGKLDLKVRNFLWSNVIHEAIAVVSVIAKERQIQIRVEDETSSVASADPDRMIQVLVNLLGNALKFSPSGGVVFVRAAEHDDEYEIAVEDNGPGVPQSQQDAIFERFQQGNLEGEDVKEGSGLGLAICKAIIEQHGGSVGVRSEGGLGSRFWFRVPKIT